jgi:peptidylprolyl isomerase
VPTEKRQRQKEGQRVRREAARAELQRQQRRRRLRLTAIFGALLVIVLVLVSVVGGDDDKDKDDEAKGSTTTSSSPPTTAASTTPTSAKPEAPAAGTGPVTKLVIEDIKVGDGDVVEKGDTIIAHYLGATYADGKEFQASWDSGQTFETAIGVGAVIKGWDDGIPGMRVGGRRKLIIPAADAYGAEDTGDGRPHGDLVFIIDVYEIK